MSSISYRIEPGDNNVIIVFVFQGTGIVFLLDDGEEAPTHLGDTRQIYVYKRPAPKVMPPIYFHGNYNRYKEHNNTI